MSEQYDCLFKNLEKKTELSKIFINFIAIINTTVRTKGNH
jgi:hypothetical protein